MNDCKAVKAREGLADIKTGLCRIYVLIRELEGITTEMMNEADISAPVPQNKDISPNQKDPAILVLVEDAVCDLEPRLEVLAKNLNYLRVRIFGHPTTNTKAG